MNMSFYTGAVGARQQQQRMGVQANNIANVNTYGYKAEQPSFASLMYGNITGINNAQLPRGSGARMVMANTDFHSGAMAASSISQSYAIQGNGFFALVDPASGEISYTREGAFTLSQYYRNNEEGEPEEVWYLSDGEGRFVLSKQGAPIEVTDSNADQPVGVFDFVNTDGMLHADSSRFLPVEKNGQVRLGTGVAQRGMLETSNADLATELVSVIEAQRSYSYALKMVQASDEIETTINGLRG